MQSEPFVMVKEEFQEWYEDPERRGQLKREHMNGFLIDLMTHIMQPYDIEYEISFVKDGAYGAQSEDGTWNGMIGELLRGVSPHSNTLLYPSPEGTYFTTQLFGIVLKTPQKLRKIHE